MLLEHVHQAESIQPVEEVRNDGANIRRFIPAVALRPNVHAVADEVGKRLRFRDEQHIGWVLGAGIELSALVALAEFDVVDGASFQGIEAAIQNHIHAPHLNRPTGFEL